MGNPPVNETPVQATQMPELQTVAWFSEWYGMSENQVYDAIATKQIPPECVTRCGRRIRFIVPKVLAWVNGSLKSEEVCDVRR